MNSMCIDTGTKESAIVIVGEPTYRFKDGIMFGEIVMNDGLYDFIPRMIKFMGVERVICEMITLFGGQRKSSHIAESILVIGEIKAYCMLVKVPFYRIARSQVVNYFLKRDKEHADRKLSALMKERIGVKRGHRHEILRYDIWQAYTLYEYAKDHNFSKWFEPKLDAPKVVLTPEQRHEKQKKYLTSEKNRIDKALIKLNGTEISN